jgi:hypothetical protein
MHAANRPGGKGTDGCPLRPGPTGVSGKSCGTPRSRLTASYEAMANGGHPWDERAEAALIALGQVVATQMALRADAVAI